MTYREHICKENKEELVYYDTELDHWIIRFSGDDYDFHINLKYCPYCGIKLCYIKPRN